MQDFKDPLVENYKNVMLEFKKELWLNAGWKLETMPPFKINNNGQKNNNNTSKETNDKKMIEICNNVLKNNDKKNDKNFNHKN